MYPRTVGECTRTPMDGRRSSELLLGLMDLFYGHGFLEFHLSGETFFFFKRVREERKEDRHFEFRTVECH